LEPSASCYGRNDFVHQRVHVLIHRVRVGKKHFGAAPILKCPYIEKLHRYKNVCVKPFHYAAYNPVGIERVANFRRFLRV
jgi:hypothetical protein